MITRSPRIAIVGAGLAGLATAVKLRLAAPGVQLTLFEANDRVGGVIHSERVDGYLIDHGADMFATEPSGVIELCRQIGIDDRLIEPKSSGRGARIVRRGRLVPVPEGFIVMRATRSIPMLTTPLLSPAGKLRFLAERWIQPAGGEDESIGNFVRRRMGQQVLDRIVAPLAAGIYTGDVDRLSMQATMGPVAEMERRYGSLAKANAASGASNERQSAGARYDRFRSFHGGMIELIQGLANQIPPGAIRLNSPVRSIEHENQRFRIRCESEIDQLESHSFDHLVLTTPAAVTAPLIRDIAPVAAQELQAIESTSTAIVVLGLRACDIRHDISTFGFVVPPTENRKILAGSFASHKFEGRAADGHVLIRCFIGGALQSELLNRSDDELVQIVIDELTQLIGLSGSPQVARVVRWNNAMPQYHVGHLKRVDRIEQDIAKIPGLALVSNALRGVGIAAVVRAAGQVAECMISSFTPSRDTPCGDTTGMTDTR